MWAVRMFLMIIFLIIAIAFFIANSGQRVDIAFDLLLFHYRHLDAPLWGVLLVAFGAGMIASFLLAVTYFFRISSDSAANKRLIKRLEAEITSLRNRQIDQIDSI
jgi:uncharacterized membrane protein YciS (DUF1049 family)